MAHEWHRGVLTTSSWHGLEEIGVLETADDVIAAGERTGAYPVSTRFADISTSCGLALPGRGVVGTYADGHEAGIGVVGGFYRPTEAAEWRSLVTAAVAAGAKPTGAFALRGGSRVLATFDLGGNGVRTKLVLADSFDGSLKLTAGSTSVVVVCANTIAAAMRQDGRGWAGLLHTSSLETKVNVLREAISETVKTGEKVRDTFHKAEATELTSVAADAVFDVLFPDAAEGDSKLKKTMRKNVREEARLAMANVINRYGSGHNNLATIWNGATYLVDRRADGSARAARGDSDGLDSMLFGSRAKRIAEIQQVVEVVMANGELAKLTVTDAREHGVDEAQIAADIRRQGRSVLDEMLEAVPA